MFARACVVATAGLLLASAMVIVPSPLVGHLAAASGPVAEWTFDDGAGTTASDAVGNLDGTITGGATWVTGDVAQGSGALQFDGIDDLVTVTNHPALEPASLSITAWIKLEDQSSGYMVVAAKGSDGCEGSSYDILTSGVEILGFVDTPPVNDWVRWQSQGARLADGVWHQIAYTFDAPSGIGRWFVDGRAEESAMVAPLYGLPGGDALTIGGYSGECAWIRPFAGTMDDVRLYDRALSAAEISAALPEIPTVTTVEWPANPIPQNQTQWFKVTVSPPPSTGGIVTLQEMVDGHLVDLTLGGLDTNTGIAYLGLVDGNQLLPEGDFDLYVHYAGSGIYQPSTSAAHNAQIRREANAVTLSASRPTVYPGQSVQLEAVAQQWTASFDIWDSVDGAAPMLVATVPAGFLDNHYHGSLVLDDLAFGVHAYTAVSAENSAYLSGTSNVAAVSSAKRPTETWISPEGFPEVNHPFAIHVSVNAADPREAAVGVSGTVTLWDGATMLGEAPVIDAVANFSVPTFSVGTHQLSATYSGDAVFAASSGASTLDIDPDVVEVSGVGVTYSTFYPYKDGYRDTVALHGTRLEPASVSIRIYDATSGALVRSASVGLGSGAWSWAWNGRTSSGTLLPATKYRVVQSLTDAAGVHLSVTSYTTLSNKRLYTYTKTLTKSYTQFSRKTTSWIGWSFTLPSATVYKSLTFSIYGKDSMGGGGFGPQDFSRCSTATWSTSCATRHATFPSTYAWRSVAGSVTYDRTGVTARLYAWGGYGGTLVSYGRVTVTYGLLR